MRTGYRKQRQNCVIRTCCIALILFFLCVLGDPVVLRETADRHIYQVYCVGDSITYGNGLEEWEWGEASYPARLQQFLGPRYKVYNYGISGATLMEIPKKAYNRYGYLDLIRQQSPDIVVLMLGTNDSKKKNWDAEAYRGQYAALVESIKELESIRYIYLMAPPEAYPGQDGKVIYGIDNDVICNEIREIVSEVAKEAGAGWIDICSVMQGHPEYFTEDGLHPNRTGYAVIAHTVGEQIRADKRKGLF